MSQATRKKVTARFWPAPVIDQLEGRALLSGSTVTTHHAANSVHAEVTKTPAHAQNLDTAMLRDAVKAYTPGNHSATTANVKAAKHATPAKVKAKAPAHLKLFNLTDLVKSPLDTKKAQATGGPVAGSFSPQQLETAYTVSSLGLANQGQGQTIGIVDEFNDPNIIGDANAYSAQYGLPLFNTTGGPTLTVIKDSALGVVGSAAGTGVGGETSLDVEVAHAMAPKANIVMIFVPATGSLDNQFVELLHGVQLAAMGSPGVPPASVVSLSYGFYETNLLADPTPYPNQSFIDLAAEYNLDTTYLQSAPVKNIAVTVSTGDSSYPGYPGSSPNVIGVGGTSLFLTASGQYNFETAWGGATTSGAAGGGSKALYATPSYQSSNGVTLKNGRRADPDVALVADPFTPVSIYDSLDASSNGGSPWEATGGTSVASPVFAGMLALAQQDRAAASKAPLTTAQIHNAIYGLYNSPAYKTYFHDVTLGRNNDAGLEAFFGPGFPAGPGYDQATGLGSPIGKTLIPYLGGLP